MKKMKTEADGVFRLGISKENNKEFFGNVEGVKVNRAWLDEGGDLHVVAGDTTITASKRVNDYGGYYIVNFGEHGYFVTAKETFKEKRPYLQFSKMRPREEKATYGTK